MTTQTAVLPKDSPAQMAKAIFAFTARDLFDKF
jgi:hypothetical protein